MKNKMMFILVPLVLILASASFSLWYMVRSEGRWQGEPLEARRGEKISVIEKALKDDMVYMSVTLGERNVEKYGALSQCEKWIRERWESMGYKVQEQVFEVEGKRVANLEVEIPGLKAPSEIVIVSAQYDTLPGSPGANNDASGVAILLQLSEMFREYRPDRTLRLINFTTEEPPYFGTELMGSLRYAKRCRQLSEDVRVVLSLDALGFFRDSPDTQKLPFPFSYFYPDRANFLAFIGDLRTRPYMIVTTRGFKKGSAFPIAAGSAPRWVKGAGWSDHSSFWRYGYRGMQVTDTGAFRSPWHTNEGDTVDKLDFRALARITMGLYASVIELTSTNGK
jgi:hypothetical protein